MTVVLGLGSIIWLRWPDTPPPPPPSASIQIEQIPSYRPLGGLPMEDITGSVAGIDVSGHVVVIYACIETDNLCYVQPFANDARTAIGSDGKWEGETRGGSSYVAMLAESSFEPPARIRSASAELDGVIARTIVEGRR